jgi:alkanesulfonate monooxygenase SsuD/methylene tetrahydromethanopterin reductase-like flavin-dependent oxidoreductase (luciferase family)
VDWESEAQRVYEALEQIPFAKEQGFDGVWSSEIPSGLVAQQCPRPDLGRAKPARTSRIRLGIWVVLTPIHHPQHVAQHMATLDILSRGRVVRSARDPHFCNKEKRSAS